MASDPQEQRTGRILDFLESKGLRECPVCHGVQFSVGPEHIILESAHYAEPSEASAVVPVLCENCGHIMFFSARTLRRA
jgi:hypothetical protein